MNNYVIVTYLHSPSIASGACCRRSVWACWGLRQQLVATWAEFQHSMVYCATDQFRKDWKHHACINAERGHWTLAVTLLAWHSNCHTSQPVLSRATDVNPQLSLFRAFNVWQNATNLQSNEKVLQFTRLFGDIFRWGRQVDYRLFSCEIM